MAEAVRRIEFWPGDEGMGHALVTMPADGMALFRSTLDAAAQAMKSAMDDGRTMDQLRVDALIELSRRALALGGSRVALRGYRCRVRKDGARTSR